MDPVPTAEGTEKAVPTIAHVVPYDGIGGVEIASASVPAGRYPTFVFHKVFIASKRRPTSRPFVYESGVGPENNPRAFLRTVLHLLRAKPDVLVLSLWRSCIVGLIVKALRPRTALVMFLHNTRDSNSLDTVLTRMTARFASRIWADSASTSVQRLGPAWAARTQPISFLTARLQRVTGDHPTPRFITWGRLHARKRIELALAFFALVHARHANARFIIIGPDRGERSMLEAKVTELGLAEAVVFAGPADRDAIVGQARDHSFFVQTSRFEGMGMAVVEAMQLGLVPVVTPVGEIATYVEDGVNGVWFTSPGQAMDRVEQLLADTDAYRAMSAAAARTWSAHPLYRDEFLAACDALAQDRIVRR